MFLLKVDHPWPHDYGHYCYVSFELPLQPSKMVACFPWKEIEEALPFPGIPAEQASLATFHKGDGVRNLLVKLSQ